MKTAADAHTSVVARYSRAAQEREAALCCPVDYDPRYLKIIPEQVIARDYGCGDPSRYVKEGDTVLDLGSGGGKICFIAAQIAGPGGRVIGVDMNDEMLTLARQAKSQVAGTLGYDNVEFHKGRIEDLKLSYDRLDEIISSQPVNSASDFLALDLKMDELRATEPMIPDASIDVVVSNCVLNLVAEERKTQMIREIFRVLKKGGRAAISDIVSDEVVPEHLKKNPELWSGCISGAFQEREFLKVFEEAGFYGVRIDKREETPWQTIEGIEFRSVTLVAWKGKEGPCKDHNEAVIYRGPFLSVTDDDGHTYRRGERVAVCRKTGEILTGEAYREHFFTVPPLEAVKAEDAPDFPCTGGMLLRHPRATKGEDYALTTEACGTECC